VTVAKGAPWTRRGFAVSDRSACSRDLAPREKLKFQMISPRVEEGKARRTGRDLEIHSLRKGSVSSVEQSSCHALVRDLSAFCKLLMT